MFNITCNYKLKNNNSYTGDLIISFLGLNLFKFPFITGGYGKGYAPFGKCKISEIHRIDDIIKNKAYKKDGFPWFVRLEPTFKTERTGLGIHPDGNIKGTLGCIGILKDDILLFYVLKYLLKWFKKLEIKIRRV